MIEKMNLFFEMDEAQSSCQRAIAIIKKCCESEYDEVIVEFKLNNIYGNKFFKKFIKMQRALKKRTAVNIKSIFVCTPEQLSGLNLRFLHSKGVTIKVLLTQLKNMDCILNIDSKHPVQIELSNSIAAEDFISLFNEWLFSENKAEIINYSSLLKLLLMKERSGCEHNSCLGGALSVDVSGMLYWCKHNKPEAKLCHFNDVKDQDFHDLFDRSSFEEYLDMHFQKREQCKAECITFDLCQGGCPIRCDTSNKCHEHEFIEQMDKLSLSVRSCLKMNDLSRLNKLAKKIILDAAAYAPFSDVFMDIQMNKNE